MVFPTPVGVFPGSGLPSALRRRLPHARGGVSSALRFDEKNIQSSPRPWGCFLYINRSTQSRRVFPTPVGVFLSSMVGASGSAGLPHARGGVSQGEIITHEVERSSPRPWGCFLCCAHHQDCRRRLPHARGGVSAILATLYPTAMSSPRPWGCFSLSGLKRPTPAVFPTPVGVFPGYRALISATLCLPHARGGVSAEYRAQRGYSKSSPRPWGCFLRARQRASRGTVFPTPVGVFLRTTVKRLAHSGLPHARGGVSKALAGDTTAQMSSPRPWGCFSRM